MPLIFSVIAPLLTFHMDVCLIKVFRFRDALYKGTCLTGHHLCYEINILGMLKSSSYT